MEQAEHDQQEPSLQALLSKLSQQVSKLSDRLLDVEDHVSDLSTEVRLQARRNSIVAAVAPLHLPSAPSHDGDHGGIPESAAASPRVAGPLSVVAAPRGKCSSRPTSLFGAPNSARAQQAVTVPPLQSPRQAAVSAASSSASPPGPGATTADGGSQGSLSAAGCQTQPSGSLGVFNLVKTWGDGGMTDSTDLKQVSQTATDAANAATAAQGCADRCQQQIFGMRGRQGLVERRLDTLWQLQETASSNQEALVHLQVQLSEQQVLAKQQHESIAALQAQVQQLDQICTTNKAACDNINTSMQQLQQLLDSNFYDIQQRVDQVAAASEQQQTASHKLRSDMAAAQQQLLQKLKDKQTQVDSCAATSAAAVSKCEELRQGVAVLAGRVDAVTGQIKGAVEPLNSRLSQLAANAATWAKSASMALTAVQSDQLATGLAQLSTSAMRKDHERAQQLAGLASRLDILERESTQRCQMVTQDDMHHAVSELRASTAASIHSAVQRLQAQLQAKADEASTSKVTSSLAGRFNSSETSLLLSLRALRDRTAVLLEGKADAAVVRKWQQDMIDSLADVTAWLPTCAAAGQQRTQRIHGRQGGDLHSPHGDCRSHVPHQCHAVSLPRCAYSTPGHDQEPQQQQQQQASASDAQAVAFDSSSVSRCVAAAEAALSCHMPPEGLATTAQARAAAQATSQTHTASTETRAGTLTAECGQLGLSKGMACTTTASLASCCAPGSLASSGSVSMGQGRRRNKHPAKGLAGVCVGSLGSPHQQQMDAGVRPFSALQPWSVPCSPPATAHKDLSGAATNAKLALSVQQKEVAQQQLTQKQLQAKILSPRSCKQDGGTAGA